MMKPSGAIYYKAFVDKTTQIECHADVQNENTEPLSHGLRQNINIVDMFGLY